MGHESKSSGKQGNTENERTQARVNHGKFSRTQLVFWLAQIWLWKHEEETLFILPKLRKHFDLCARMSHKKGTILDTACALVVLVAPVAVEDFASRLRHVSLPRSQSLHRPRSTCLMWELRISLFYFVQAFPSTDSMCSTVSKSLAYPYHTAIEMCSAPFQKQVQTWLWLWVLYCCIWFSWFQVHTASIFLHQVHGYSVCLFLSRMFLFLSQARVPPFPTPPVSASLQGAEAPWLIICLPLSLPHVRILAVLWIQLRCSFSEVWCIQCLTPSFMRVQGRDITRSPATVFTRKYSVIVFCLWEKILVGFAVLNMTKSTIV